MAWEPQSPAQPGKAPDRPAAQAGDTADAAVAADAGSITGRLEPLGAATQGPDLTLDPDIDTCHLMDAAQFGLPAMV